MKTKKISRIENIFASITLIIGLLAVYFYIFFSYIKNEEIIKQVSKNKINQKSNFETHKLLKNKKSPIVLKDVDKNLSLRIKEKYQEINKFQNEIKKNNIHLALLKEKLILLEEKFNSIKDKIDDLMLKIQQEEDINKRKELQIEQIQLRTEYHQKHHLIACIKEIERKNIFLKIDINDCNKSLNLDNKLQQYFIQQDNKHKIVQGITKN